jgi:hypothetical protein
MCRYLFHLVWEEGQWLTTVLFTNPKWCIIWFSNCACLHNLLPTPARLLWVERNYVLSKVLGLLYASSKDKIWPFSVLWSSHTYHQAVVSRCHECYSRNNSGGLCRDRPTEASQRKVTHQVGPEGWVRVWQTKGLEEKNTLDSMNGLRQTLEQQGLFGKWWLQQLSLLCDSLPSGSLWFLEVCGIWYVHLNPSGSFLTLLVEWVLITEGAMRARCNFLVWVWGKIFIFALSISFPFIKQSHQLLFI